MLELAKYGMDERLLLLKRDEILQLSWEERKTNFKPFTCPGIRAETTVRC
jgi:hypothetical protein